MQILISNVDGKNQAGGSQELSKDQNGNWICPKCGNSSKHLAKMSSVDDLGCMDCWGAFKGHGGIGFKVAKKLIRSGTSKEDLEKEQNRLEKMKNDLERNA